jgi:hypothetical protein
MNNQQQSGSRNQSGSRKTSSTANNGRKSNKMLAIKLLSRDGSKPTRAFISQKSVRMTRCSDPARGVHSASYGHTQENLILQGDSGDKIIMTFPEAQVLIERMKQDSALSCLFSSSM